MKELIAKKYVQALYKSLDTNSLENASEFFTALASVVSEPSVAKVLNAPQVSKEQRVEILLSAVEKTDSKEIQNIIKLIVENGRISVIPEIAVVLNKVIATTKREYNGVVYSDSEVSQEVLNELGQGLGKRFDASITLQYQKEDFDGIKVDVEDLGIEISFSKTRINKQIVEHILKAI
ncbi:MAG: F0F1 ATP synthase subunit delta [Epsilonproteobacteria bacterium]|nr:F0F1 ATP synthase subunit delta [Campylobacterota bacterium]